MKALSRPYEGSVKTLLRLHERSIEALLRWTGHAAADDAQVATTHDELLPRQGLHADMLY